MSGMLDGNNSLTLTPADFRSAGFRVALTVSQDELNRAVSDVLECYVGKVKPNYDPTSAEVKEATMQLATMLLCQRNAVATRSGGREKTSPQLSERGYYTIEDVRNADRLLRKLSDAKPEAVVTDILGMYMYSYFH